MASLLPSENIRGAAWMLAGSMCFAAVGIAVKQIGTDLPVTVVAFFRAFFGLVFIVPFIVRQGPSIFYTKRPGLHVVRLFGAAGSILGAYYGLAHLPLATAVSLSFTRPLFMILIAVIFLGEVVRWRRGLATLIGFAGVLVMLGPTGLAFNAAALASLAGAASVAVALAVIRRQAAIEGPLPFLAWYVVGSVILMGPLAAMFWETPQGIQWAYLAFIGLGSSFGQYFLVKALSMAESTAMAPVDYTQIIIAAIFGYMLFGEMPTVWTALGAAVIATATLYIVFREARLKRTLPPVAPAD
jgi:drug/metabolite transporter (DMT)-like permease